MQDLNVCILYRKKLSSLMAIMIQIIEKVIDYGNIHSKRIFLPYDHNRKNTTVLNLKLRMLVSQAGHVRKLKKIY